MLEFWILNSLNISPQFLYFQKYVAYCLMTWKTPEIALSAHWAYCTHEGTLHFIIHLKRKQGEDLSMRSSHVFWWVER